MTSLPAENWGTHTPVLETSNAADEQVAAVAGEELIVAGAGDQGVMAGLR